MTVRAHHASKKGRTEEQRLEVQRLIRQYVAAGWDDHEVARELGCSDQTVFRYRKKNGIPPAQKL